MGVQAGAVGCIENIVEQHRAGVGQVVPALRVVEGTAGDGGPDDARPGVIERGLFGTGQQPVVFEEPGQRPREAVGVGRARRAEPDVIGVGMGEEAGREGVAAAGGVGAVHPRRLAQGPEQLDAVRERHRLASAVLYRQPLRNLLPRFYIGTRLESQSICALDRW